MYHDQKASTGPQDARKCTDRRPVLANCSGCHRGIEDEMLGNKAPLRASSAGGGDHGSRFPETRGSVVLSATLAPVQRVAGVACGGRARYGRLVSGSPSPNRGSGASSTMIVALMGLPEERSGLQGVAQPRARSGCGGWFVR
jgi:hypothetical protein